MKICMVTTFFGAHSFGGDAAYVERLSHALARAGHEVHVLHCGDAFQAVRGKHPLRPFNPPPGVHVHRLGSPWKIFSPLATQATGQPIFKRKTLKAFLDAPDTDVVHFHNISLVGGPGILNMGRNAVRIMTAHEHWLICPMHLLWKYGKRACEKPECVRCSIAGKRPPQLWRNTDAIPRGLDRLDALIFPSQHTLDEHVRRGVRAERMIRLPYFLPDGWPSTDPATPYVRPHVQNQPSSERRPYLAAAGRLVRMKGFQELIPLMRYLPEADLKIAGTGPYESVLRKQAAGLPNVHFVGLLGGVDLADLFAQARAVVVPSLFPETFGYVVLEAFSVGTPVVVNMAGGAIAETGVESGGGLGYRNGGEFLVAMRRMIHDDALRNELGERGLAQRLGPWSEEAHIRQYMNLLDELGAARALRTENAASRTIIRVDPGQAVQGPNVGQRIPETQRVSATPGENP